MVNKNEPIFLKTDRTEIIDEVLKGKKDKKLMGKKSKAAGGRFELKVRKDLESKGWIVSKWMNNVEFSDAGSLNDEIYECPKCKIRLDNFHVADSFENPERNYPMDMYVERFAQTLSLNSEKHKKRCGEYLKKICDGPSCRKIGKLIPAKHKFRGPGIPMSIGTGFPDFIIFRELILGPNRFYLVSGVESKMNGILDKIEKEKCSWLLKNNIFSKILIAKKGKKRGEIVYNEFLSE